MPQFTNSYNSQNGMGQMGPSNMSGGFNGQSSNMNPQNYMMGNQQGSMSQPMQSPWEQQGWKSYSQPPVRPLVGKWVDSFNDIKPQDVPMDGSMCFFPLNDYSCVYAMVWGNDGQIKPYRLVPEKEQPQVQQEPISDPVKEVLNGFTSSMYNRMDALERRIGDILESFTEKAQPKTKKTVVKESDAT